MKNTLAGAVALVVALALVSIDMPQARSQPAAGSDAPAADPNDDDDATTGRWKIEPAEARRVLGLNGSTD